MNFPYFWLKWHNDDLTNVLRIVLILNMWLDDNFKSKQFFWFWVTEVCVRWTLETIYTSGWTCWRCTLSDVVNVTTYSLSSLCLFARARACVRACSRQYVQVVSSYSTVRDYLKKCSCTKFAQFKSQRASVENLRNLPPPPWYVRRDILVALVTCRLRPVCSCSFQQFLFAFRPTVPSTALRASSSNLWKFPVLSRVLGVDLELDMVLTADEEIFEFPMCIVEEELVLVRLSC
jgi:hypothetical protein